MYYIIYKKTDAKYIIQKRNNKGHVLVPQPFRTTPLPTTTIVDMILRLLHVADYAYLFTTCPASPEENARQMREYKSLSVAISRGHMLCHITA